jgi:uncharacterized membrane protein YfcA
MLQCASKPLPLMRDISSLFAFFSIAAGVSLIIGASIGFLSGLLGIGGGILLTPILLFLRWTTIKQAAGISALFIFLNSISKSKWLLIKNIKK